MKSAIHPKYFESAEAKCSCGNVIVFGSTQEKMKTELCSKCHPFYTGLQRLVDTAGMVDKFQAKRKAAELHKQAKAEHDLAKKEGRYEPVEKKTAKKTVKAAEKKAVKAPKKTVSKAKKTKAATPKKTKK